MMSRGRKCRRELYHAIYFRSNFKFNVDFNTSKVSNFNHFISKFLKLLNLVFYALQVIESHHFNSFSDLPHQKNYIYKRLSDFLVKNWKFHISREIMIENWNYPKFIRTLQNGSEIYWKCAMNLLEKNENSAMILRKKAKDSKCFFFKQIFQYFEQNILQFNLFHGSFHQFLLRIFFIFRQSVEFASKIRKIKLNFCEINQMKIQYFVSSLRL